MSILSSLTRAYERLPDSPPFGFSTQNIHGCIVLNRQGKLVGKPFVWGYDAKGRIQPRRLNVPYFGGRSGTNAPPYFLWDNSAYVLGVTRKEGFDAEKRFKDFQQFHLEALNAASDEGLRAVSIFLENWFLERFGALSLDEELKDRNIVFRLEGDAGFIHERDAAAEVWAKIFKPDTIGEAVCLISGNRDYIARIHPPIVSFENPARIVSFDKDSDAFASYGHVQAENAPIAISTAFAYTAVLNRFLQRDSGHRVQIGDASTVFWADASDIQVAKEAEGVFALIFGAEEAKGGTPEEDEAEARKIGILLERLRKGEQLEDLDAGLAKGVRFHVLGLAPNAARLSIRFYFEDDFSTLARNYHRFVSDMEVEPAWREPYPQLWRYLREVAVLGKSENVPPNLAGEWMRAILSGTRYPMTLFSAVLSRIRADGEVNALRVAILRALLVRNFKKERETPVAFDPKNENKGYLLGRLFAVYEQAQSAALGRNVNATIKDKFYGAASATPRSVFALLDRGSANHLSKVGKERPGQRVNLEKAIGAIMEMMSPGDEPFPASLGAEDQAMFGLGYYHQRGEFFRKRDAAGTEEAA